MKSLMNLLFISIVGIGLNGCGGESTPTDEDDTSVVKLTDLKSGYLAKGILESHLQIQHHKVADFQ